MFLVYGGEEELVAKCYVDASFDTDPDDSKSQSGYVFLMNGGAVSWRSSKQPVVAGSKTEAEYVAASEAAQEAVWMKEFISEIGVVGNELAPMVIFYGNNGAIANTKDPTSHKHSKHIKRRFHSIREHLNDGDIKIYK